MITFSLLLALLSTPSTPCWEDGTCGYYERTDRDSTTLFDMSNEEYAS